MRIAALLVLLFVAIPSAQAPSMRVSITEGSRNAWLMPTPEPSTTGGPWAAIPAQPLTPGSTLSVSAFRLRAWIEGAAARVVLLAVTRDPDTNQERDTQIATFLMTPGDSIVATQTERYGAAHVVITASDTAPAAAADAQHRYLNVRSSLF